MSEKPPTHEELAQAVDEVLAPALKRALEEIVWLRGELLELKAWVAELQLRLDATSEKSPPEKP